MKGKSGYKPTENDILKFILSVLYHELHAHVGDCESCDDVTFLFRKLQSLCKELRVKVEPPND